MILFKVDGPYGFELEVDDTTMTLQSLTKLKEQVDAAYLKGLLLRPHPCNDELEG